MKMKKTRFFSHLNPEKNKE